MNEIDLVNLVLSAHQTAYAKFHNGEGHDVIESDQLAIGYASVELAKALGRYLQDEWDKGYKAALENVVSGKEKIIQRAKDSGLL